MSKLATGTYKMLNVITILLMTLSMPGSALAAVWTEPIDATPGSIVTIHGDNSDEDTVHNWLPGELVHVEVIGWK